MTALEVACWRRGRFEGRRARKEGTRHGLASYALQSLYSALRRWGTQEGVLKFRCCSILSPWFGRSMSLVLWVCIEETEGLLVCCIWLVFPNLVCNGFVRGILLERCFASSFGTCCLRCALYFASPTSR